MKFICISNVVKANYYSSSNKDFVYNDLIIGEIYSGEIYPELVSEYRRLILIGDSYYESFLFKDLSEYRNEQIDSILKD